MQLHQLQRTHPNKRAKRVGRGGKRGKTSGRGHKGQKAHAGGGPRPEMRDTIKRLPKKRGYGKNRARSGIHGTAALPVNVAALERHFAAGETVSPKTLAQKGLVRLPKKGSASVKILGDGDLSKKLSVKHCLVSASAAEKITKAGGTVA